MFNVGGVPDPNGDPTGFWQHVMAFGSTCGDQLIAHAGGKRQIGEPASVEMAQLTTTDTKFDAAETMRRHRHVGPR